MKDTCAHCKKELAGLEVIYAAMGSLYCSRECGIASYHTHVAYFNAEMAFDDTAEEVNPVDIGIE